jgi:hypothetical protein
MTIENFLRLLVYALAAYRVTHMLWLENGPYDVFDWLRAKAGIWYSEAVGKRTASIGGFWGKLLNCPDCLSVWVAVVAVALWLLQLWVLDVLAAWLAVSAICVALINKEKEDA